MTEAVLLWVARRLVDLGFAVVAVLAVVFVATVALIWSDRAPPR